MRVRAVTNCAIGTNYYKEGDEFEYDGPPNHNLEPLEKPAATKTEKADEEDAEDSGKTRFSKHK